MLPVKQLKKDPGTVDGSAPIVNGTAIEWSDVNTSGIKIPAGTTAQRGIVPHIVRRNTTLNVLEYFDGTTWIPFDGDMSKSVYDTNGDGIVDASASIDGVAAAGPSMYYGTNPASAPGFYAVPGVGVYGPRVLSSLTAQAFEYPDTSITNPFTNAINTASAVVTSAGYNDSIVSVSTVLEMPLQFLQRFSIPSDAVALNFRILFGVENPNVWAGEIVDFKFQYKSVAHNGAWSTESVQALGSITLPATGTAMQIFTPTTIPLTTLGLSVGDVVMGCLTVASTSTYASNIAIYSTDIISGV